MTNNRSPDMHETWLELLKPEFEKPYMQNLRKFLIQEKIKEKRIYPSNKKTFRALKLTGVDDVKVVILGQDPYHGRNQANGLAFSVEKGLQIPPSLRNIYKEIKEDLGMEPPKHGDLSFLASGESAAKLYKVVERRMVHKFEIDSRQIYRFYRIYRLSSCCNVRDCCCFFGV